MKQLPEGVDDDMCRADESLRALALPSRQADPRLGGRRNQELVARHRFTRSTLRPLLIVLSAVLVVTGCGGDSADSAPTAQGTAPAGSSAVIGLVDIGGRSLFLDCRGSGRPTVVLEAGLTGDHRTWERVVPKIRDQARVCTYDRANIGSSQSAPKPRTAADMVSDLHALLAASGEPPPYVLVGFSFGGLVTQYYARSHPDLVAGLVLVESNHPREEEEFEAHLTPAQIAADRAQGDANPEGIDLYTSFEQVRAAGRLPRVPLVVVTAGVSEGWPPGWDAELFDQLRAEEQADLAGMVPGGMQVFARNSGHDVPREQPEVIVDSIRTVLSQSLGGGA